MVSIIFDVPTLPETYLRTFKPALVDAYCGFGSPASLPACYAATKVDAWLVEQPAQAARWRRQDASSGGGGDAPSTQVQSRVYQVDFPAKSVAMLDAQDVVQIIRLMPASTAADLFGHSIVAVYASAPILPATASAGTAARNATLPANTTQAGGASTGAPTAAPTEGEQGAAGAAAKSDDGITEVSIAIIIATLAFIVLVCTVLVTLYVRTDQEPHQMASDEWVVHSNVAPVVNMRRTSADQDQRSMSDGPKYARPISQSYFDPVPSAQDSWAHIQAILLADHGADPNVSAGYSAYGMLGPDGGAGALSRADASHTPNTMAQYATQGPESVAEAGVAPPVEYTDVTNFAATSPIYSAQQAQQAGGPANPSTDGVDAEWAAIQAALNRDRELWSDEPASSAATAAQAQGFDAAVPGHGAGGQGAVVSERVDVRVDGNVEEATLPRRQRLSSELAGVASGEEAEAADDGYIITELEARPDAPVIGTSSHFYPRGGDDAPNFTTFLPAQSAASAASVAVVGDAASSPMAIPKVSVSHYHPS